MKRAACAAIIPCCARTREVYFLYLFVWYSKLFPFAVIFSVCGLCAAPLTGSFEGVEKKRKETKRNERVSLQKTREGDPWKRNEKGQLVSLSLRSCPHGFSILTQVSNISFVPSKQIFLVLLKDTTLKRKMAASIFCLVSYAQKGHRLPSKEPSKEKGGSLCPFCAYCWRLLLLLFGIPST